MQRYGTSRVHTIVINNHFQMNFKEQSDISGVLGRSLPGSVRTADNMLKRFIGARTDHKRNTE